MVKTDYLDWVNVFYTLLYTVLLLFIDKLSLKRIS
jgi:hypothetical protein